MKNLPDKAFFRPDEVALYCGVARSTVYLWIETGRLPAVKIAGKLIRISREALKGLGKTT